MAIDFMIMPLSRYLSGDFVTPAMTFAWAQGLTYTLVGPEGRRDIPKGTPFGGPDAAANRARFVPMIREDLRKVAVTVEASLWDEGSEAEPCFHRVDPTSFGALLEEVNQATRPSLLGFLRKRSPPHLAASLFLPASFETPFDMPVILERVAGSAPAALRELEAGHWSDRASSARATLSDALRDSVRLKLPMVVDA